MGAYGEMQSHHAGFCVTCPIEMSDLASLSLLFYDGATQGTTTGLGHGSAGKRPLHAAEHLFVAHREDGSRMFNYSEWLGSASSAALSNVYHPGNQHGVWDTAARRIQLLFQYSLRCAA